jgi:hypothetical protein
MTTTAAAAAVTTTNEDDGDDTVHQLQLQCERQQHCRSHHLRWRQLPTQTRTLMGHGCRERDGWAYKMRSLILYFLFYSLLTTPTDPTELPHTKPKPQTQAGSTFENVQMHSFSRMVALCSHHHLYHPRKREHMLIFKGCLPPLPPLHP